MKKKKMLGGLLILLGIVVLLLVLTERNTTLREHESSFAVGDTTSITKIFMASMDGSSVLLEKGDSGIWTVNKEYLAQKDMVQQFLRTLMYVTVRAPVAVAARDNVLRHMASHAVKVEIYQEKYLIDFLGIRLFKRERLSKVFYVGDNSQDNTGTYMKMEKSDVPYLTYIPGFKGFLHTRFSTNAWEWRDHTIFSLFMKDIESVTMIYPEENHKSFRIENPDNRNFKLFSYELNSYVNYSDTVKMINYLSGFYDARFEYFVNDPANFARDSLLDLPPFQQLNVVPKTGKPIRMITYLKPNELDEDQLEARFFETSDYPWDRERMWAFFGDAEKLEFVSIQYFVFGRILKPIQFFLPDYQDITIEGIKIYELQSN